MHLSNTITVSFNNKKPLKTLNSIHNESGVAQTDKVNRNVAFICQAVKLFARCSLVFARCSLLSARYFLLVARYFLLVARYFSLVACYFLLVARQEILKDIF